MAWMQALWRPDDEGAPPRRILVAGCGTGAEAFVLRRRFPAADIVAFDFSETSIALAIRAQRRRHGKPVRFVVADLGSPRLAPRVGRGFDFVSCHGVLTYVPDPARGLAALAGCLAPDGALFLGVNGTRHRSVALRGALPMFGIDPRRFVDGPSVRRVLQLLDSLLPRIDRVARPTDPFLASDVFGPLLRNWTLARWVDAAREAGLHFQASYASHRDLRPVIERGLLDLLVPRSRAEVSELLEVMQPAAFHRALFTRRPPASPPWTEPDRLLDWRPVLTRVYRSRPPVQSRRPRTIVFRSPSLNALASVEAPTWAQAILRRSDGRHSIGGILGAVGAHPHPDDLVPHLYLLHQLLILNLLRPASA
jgi:SAM-dependent methyltransferase